MASPAAAGLPQSPVLVQQQFVVTGGSLQKPVVIMNTEVVQGRAFFEIVKTEAATARLLQGHVVKGKRPVCSTNVVEELQRLSLQAFAAASRPTAPDSQEHEDLGVDEIVAKKKHKSTAEMKLLNIPGPAYGDTCPAAELHAASNGSRQLWLELTPSTIEYLQLAVEAQLSMPKEDVLQPAEDAASGSNGRLPTDVRNCKFDVGRKRRSLQGRERQQEEQVLPTQEPHEGGGHARSFCFRARASLSRYYVYRQAERYLSTTVEKD